MLIKLYHLLLCAELSNLSWKISLIEDEMKSVFGHEDKAGDWLTTENERKTTIDMLG